jgi:hypothetical protein
MNRVDQRMEIALLPKPVDEPNQEDKIGKAQEANQIVTAKSAFFVLSDGSIHPTSDLVITGLKSHA